MRKNYEELIWKKLEMLTVIKLHDTIKWRSRFLCKCDCWNEKIIRRSDLWKTQSCWCIFKSKDYSLKVWEKNIKHWMNNTRIYNIWRWIKQRCDNKNLKNFSRYWWKWITYDKKWENFEWFYEDMMYWYSDELSIERIDNNKNYNKENCRWATSKEQQRNKSDTLLYKWKPLKEYCEEHNISFSAIYTRLQRWMNIEEAILKPIIKRKKNE